MGSVTSSNAWRANSMAAGEVRVLSLAAWACSAGVGRAPARGTAAGVGEGEAALGAGAGRSRVAVEVCTPVVAPAGEPESIPVVGSPEASV